MTIANSQDKTRIIDILTEAFAQNQSVNFICKQDEKRMRRIRSLMEYAFNLCNSYGKVLLNEERNACALVLLPHTKRFSVSTLFWDSKLVLKVIGIAGVAKVLRREKEINKLHPKSPFYYLWFIGVSPTDAGRGIGSILLNKLIADAEKMNLPFYLETSTAQNIPWYRKNGFRTYAELDLGYTLTFMSYGGL